MDKYRGADTALWATAGFVSAPWFNVVNPAFGIWVVGICLAAIAYINLVAPYRQRFIESEQEDVHQSDRRRIVVGLVLITTSIIGAAGFFAHMQFPREMTVTEGLRVFYVECNELQDRAEDISDDQYDAYFEDFREWHFATLHYIKTNLLLGAPEKFASYRDTGTNIGNPGRAKNLAKVIRSRCENLATMIENPGWRNDV